MKIEQLIEKYLITEIEDIDEVESAEDLFRLMDLYANDDPKESASLPLELIDRLEDDIHEAEYEDEKLFRKTMDKVWFRGLKPLLKKLSKKPFDKNLRKQVKMADKQFDKAWGKVAL